MTKNDGTFKENGLFVCYSLYSTYLCYVLPASWVLNFVEIFGGQIFGGHCTTLFPFTQGYILFIKLVCLFVYRLKLFFSVVQMNLVNILFKPLK